MAFETLRDVKEIGGIPVTHQTDDTMRPMRTPYDVVVDHSSNTIRFKLQNGPIKEVGVNGCQVDTIIEAAKLIIEGLDKKFPCDENAYALGSLDAALDSLKKRTADREKRDVEGTNQA